MLLDGGDVILIGGVHEIVEVDHSPGGLSPPSFVLDNRFCMHISITVARKLDSAAGCEVARLGAPELEITPAIVAGERCYGAGGENSAPSLLSNPRWSAPCPNLSI